jgi:hypothetical protein
VFFPPSPVVVHGHVREARLMEGPAHVVLDLLLQRRSGRPQPRVWPLPPLTRRHLRPDLPPQLRVPLQERDGLYRSTGGGHDVIVRAARLTRTRLLVCPGRPLPPTLTLTMQPWRSTILRWQSTRVRRVAMEREIRGSSGESR